MKRRDLLRLPLEAVRSGAEPVLRSAAMRPPPGSAPGMLMSMPGATEPRVRVMAYGPHELTEFYADDLEALPKLRGAYPVVWVNVDGIEHAETVRRIGDAFCLHRLALEDVMHVPQRPKVEAYDGYLFLVGRMARRTPGLDLEQISIFLGPDFVITFQERPGDPLDPVRARIRELHTALRTGGPDYLAYAVIDTFVDHYFPVLEQYADELDDLEDEVVLRPSHACMNRLHGMKRELMNLRRAMWPMREALGVLMRDSGALVKPETTVYLRDCQDHAFQIVDLVETYRETAASLNDLYLSTVSNRMNEVMKVLTIFASIFIPLGFITGLYGMNIDHPARAWYWDWPFAAGVMGGIALSLLAFFWRRGWIMDRG